MKLLLVIMLTLSQAPAAFPLYRLSRHAISGAVYPYPYSVYQLVPLSEWTCNLPTGNPPARGFRMLDPDPTHPGRECEYVALDPFARIFADMRDGFAYRYTLAVKQEEDGGWSADTEAGLKVPLLSLQRVP